MPVRKILISFIFLSCTAAIADSVQCRLSVLPKETILRFYEAGVLGFTPRTTTGRLLGVREISGEFYVQLMTADGRIQSIPVKRIFNDRFEVLHGWDGETALIHDFLAQFEQIREPLRVGEGVGFSRWTSDSTAVSLDGFFAGLRDTPRGRELGLGRVDGSVLWIRLSDVVFGTFRREIPRNEVLQNGFNHLQREFGNPLIGLTAYPYGTIEGRLARVDDQTIQISRGDEPSSLRTIIPFGSIISSTLQPRP